MEKLLSVGEAAEQLGTVQRSEAGCRALHQVRSYWPTRAHSDIGLGRLRRLGHRRARRLLLIGATLADLKKRLGHSSSAAAQCYMHAIEGRDIEISKELSVVAEGDDAQAGASATLQVRATLEQVVRPHTTTELPGQTPSARSSDQELKPITGLKWT